MLPIYSNRERVYDVLRGVAILGILLANIEAFARPGFIAEMAGLGTVKLAGIDAALEPWRNAFVNGKFRSMLAMLFGIGMAMLYAKALRTQVKDQWGRVVEGERWPGTYLRRSWFLVLLGLLHGLFIWWGDILFLYGATALVGAWVIGQPRDTQKLIFGLCVAFSLLIGVGMAALMGSTGSTSAAQDPATREIFGFLSAERELAAFASGSYLDQLGFRLVLVGFNCCQILFMIPLILVFFILGAWIFQTGVLAKPSANLPVRNRLLVVGLAVGLPMNMAVLAIPAGSAQKAYAMFLETVGAPFLAVGYLILIAMAVERAGAMWRPLELVGRFALTNYLLQSVVCSFVFYSFGARLFGKLNALEQLGVVAGVWVVNIAFSMLWARRFDIGPVEWAWRSAVERRKLPWRTISAPPIMEMRDS